MTGDLPKGRWVAGVAPETRRVGLLAPSELGVVTVQVLDVRSVQVDSK